MIKLIGVSKFYGNIHALKGITKTFDSHKIHGIVGLNGAGKTTFFNIIAGIESYSGTIKYNSILLQNSLKKQLRCCLHSLIFFHYPKERSIYNLLRKQKM